MITITFIRHGESEDNLREVWAGWKDSPLSQLGRKQAQALGQYFSTERFDHIYASPSLRACATAKAIQDAQPHPQPPLTLNPKLREQHFGVAEGQPWLAAAPPHDSMQELPDKNIFPAQRGRDAKFPEGESRNELMHRTEEAVKECILPHVQEPGLHIVVASHGLCISELIRTLLGLDPSFRKDRSYSGLKNTAWTRVTVSVQGSDSGNFNSSFPPSLKVRVTDVNVTEHLALIPPVADATEDEKQTDARTFFSGGGAASVTSAEGVEDDVIKEVRR